MALDGKITKRILYYGAAALLGLQLTGCSPFNTQIRNNDSIYIQETPSIEEKYTPSSATLEKKIYIEESNEFDVELFNRQKKLTRGLNKWTKYTPIIYWKEPKRTPKQKLLLEKNGIDVKALDEGIGKNVTDYASYLLWNFRGDKDIIKSLFLPEGYLYTKNPELADLVYLRIGLDDLFEEETLYVVRGDKSFKVKKHIGVYFKEGDSVRLSLLLNDKVSADPHEALAYNHIPIKDLQKELMFNTIDFITSSKDGVNVKLKYSNHQIIEGVLEKNNKFNFVPTSMSQEKFSDFLYDRSMFFNFINKLKTQTKQFQEDRFFFDEPETEKEGEQLDGILKQLWTVAYHQGKKEYEFRDVKYDVFAKNGNVKVPQVCIDFIIDIFESAGGSWYNPKDQDPGRSVGFLNFKDALDVKNDYDLRRIWKFIKQSKKRDHIFDFYQVPKENRVAFKEGKNFYKNLYHLIDNGMDMQPGDIIFIHGPLSDETLHYHSFIVSEVDPITGLPTQIIENPAVVKFNTLHKTLGRATKRWINNRIRIKPKWILKQRTKFEEKSGL